MRTFSKSKLLALRQCPKRLWLEVHRPDLREYSSETDSRVQAGFQVGEIARRIYDREGQGVLVDVQADGFDRAFERTAELLRTRQPIFEAGFSAGGVLTFADILLPEQTGAELVWHMIEVKSSTSVKGYHYDDLAVQALVVKAAGIPLASIALAHIDSSWIYPGNNDYHGLLKENDLTAETLSRTDEANEWIIQAQNIIAQPIEPDIETGSQCFLPFECSYNYCNRNEPKPEYPIVWLPRFSSAKVEKLAAQGIDDLRNVPDELLNDQQLKVKTHTLTNTVYFDAAGAGAGAGSDLAAYPLPAYFLDFETIQFAVPVWKGTRPYQQIVFQFSLHRLDISGQLEHTEFLDLSGNDPSGTFAQSLIAACGGQGPVFVYNAGFEMARIRELAERFPSLSQSLLAINDRIVDLLQVVRKRYYHPSQQGSWSIKKVLPAVVPELRYVGWCAGWRHGDGCFSGRHSSGYLTGTQNPNRTAASGLLQAGYLRHGAFVASVFWSY
ncbi:DUF2779 domain-containing protein [Nitrosomonas sp.]|uniref:DUF2779 domain-containing protein n=1 Tax=Nitrosomonas sp. TaxID=42353 RepID=UPI0032EF0E5A